MLAEFALTPSIFEEDAHADRDVWLDQLRELGATMFPRLSASPILVSNLYEGSWHPEVANIVTRIKDHRARKLCQDLLTKVASTLVFRPGRKDWPEDECAWGREAASSAVQEPIERIVLSTISHETLKTEGLPVRCISEVHDAGFWSGIASNGSVPMRISDQLDVLRKLCVHSDFLCVLSPHIYGGGDDETDFVKGLIASSIRRPTGYHAVSIDIHTEGPMGNPGDATFASLISKKITSISSSLKQALPSGQAVSLYVWPRLLHRYVVGGVYTETTSGERVRSPRWGISLHHFARRGDDPNQAPSPWNLLTRDALLDCFNRYFSEGSIGYLPSSPVKIITDR